MIRDGELTTAHIMDVTLACDDRILYGADGGAFLAWTRGLPAEPGGSVL